MQSASPFHLRLAIEADIPALNALIEVSVRVLQAGDYTSSQIEGALGTVLGLDTHLIADRTYFLAESTDRKEIAVCGGWSERKTLFGGNHSPDREPELLSPAIDAAKVRAVGYRRFEMGATLTGVKLYTLKGYVAA